VLYRFRDDGTGPAICATGSAASCNDDVVDLDSNAKLEAEQLEAGTYYYIVDGFGPESVGNYVFEVIVD